MESRCPNPTVQSKPKKIKTGTATADRMVSAQRDHRFCIKSLIKQFLIEINKFTKVHMQMSSQIPYLKSTATCNSA